MVDSGWRRRSVARRRALGDETRRLEAMKPLPLIGTITKVRPDFATCIWVDGGYDLVIEAPMYVQEKDREYVIDPVEGHPDVELLNRLIGRMIVNAEYSYKDGLRFSTDDGTLYHVPPTKSFESWHVAGPDHCYIGHPSDLLNPPEDD
ncbi:hypothetical protein HUN08_02940 [Gordonia sp. X0973]|uniref:DUF6188 family protein n=1 Tax=Gordonia sp. X0973 TaxID=2742602 RepID=UPI0013ED5120|nr:DUF6188 family protein [Gordonia sp. X0973]QKT06267.1 hypothetical protein HUN08_02940 [Gordonia sp. X0973]